MTESLLDSWVVPLLLMVVAPRGWSIPGTVDPEYMKVNSACMMAAMETDADLRFDRDTSNCSIARTLEVVGEKWTILILREIWYGSSRFSDFEQILGCARNLLAERLHKLVEHGILSTETYQEPGARSRLRYVITPKGVDLMPAVMGLMQWGDRYRADPEGPAVVTRHRDCGAPLNVQVRCDHDHHISAEDIETEPGPGFRMKADSQAT